MYLPYAGVLCDKFGLKSTEQITHFQSMLWSNLTADRYWSWLIPVPQVLWHQLPQLSHSNACCLVVTGRSHDKQRYTEDILKVCSYWVEWLNNGKKWTSRYPLIYPCSGSKNSIKTCLLVTLTHVKAFFWEGKVNWSVYSPGIYCSGLIANRNHDINITSIVHKRLRSVLFST